jgi:hypothetical protein
MVGIMLQLHYHNLQLKLNFFWWVCVYGAAATGGVEPAAPASANKGAL